MKTLYVSDLQKSLIISGEAFLIISCEKSEDKNGRSYYRLVLGDKTGKIDAKLWSDALLKTDEKILKSGNVVKVSGKVDEFKGTLQLNLMTLEKVDESKLDDFLESSMFDPDEMVKELDEEIHKIKNTKIKDILLKIVNDQEIRRRLKYWPAASVVHHNFRSGLLQHILEMLTISKSLVRFYPNADFDILTAGIVLHDLGKIYELDGNDLAVPYSKEGMLIGHINLSLQLFEKFGGKNLPKDTYLHIAHLILSHHGTHEFGSPVLPATLEAIMLTYIDDLSAKARTADSVIKRIPINESFSQRVVWLENAKMWKGGNGDETTESDIPQDTEDIEKLTEQLEF